MKPQVVQEILNEIDYEFARKAPPEWFPDLPRIPADRYLDEDFFQLELAAMRRCWVIVGTVHEFPETGSYKVVDRWNGAFYNVCQHRGGPVASGECGVEQRLQCAIHSWTYSLDGKLVGVPGRRDFHESLDRDKVALRPVRCETWRGFVFINLDADAPSLLDWLGPIADEATWFDGLRSAGTGSLELNCNWKVAIEANIEVYHVTTVHPDTVALALDYRGTSEELYHAGHSRMVVPANDYDGKRVHAEADSASHPLSALMDNTNVSYLLFPNHLTPGGTAGRGGKPSITLQTFWPISVDRTLSEWHVMVPDWGEGPAPAAFAKATAGYNVIMEEDTRYLEEVQKAMQSRTLDGFLTSYHERRIYHHEASIDRFIGIENVPEHLRVPQLLATAD
jgi:phenylpropionate dioxygenase-like ring-hydroxylating dioxygenase large terminal subunit